jgi:hypothetical protein
VNGINTKTLFLDKINLPFTTMKKIYIAFLLILASKVMAQKISITEVSHQNRDHFKIVTPKITYLFDRGGGGFSSMIDRNGNDWLAFSFDSTIATYPKSAEGQFRGLPNAVFGNEDGGCGHPGFTKAVSTKSAPNQISVVSKSGKWAWNYTFYNDFVIWSITQTDPNYFYWLLYEGPIAGSWNKLSDKYWGTETMLNGPKNDFYKNESYTGNFSTLFLGDTSVKRVLYIQQQTPDQLTDLIGFLGNKPEGKDVSPNGMIVAGFGRNVKGKPSMTQPNKFKIGFYDGFVTTNKQYKGLNKHLKKRNF